MNDNFYKMKLNSKYEECIYVIHAEGTSLYKILFVKGNLQGQLSQTSQFRLASPYTLTLLDTYIFNDHDVFESVTDLEEMVNRSLYLYRKDGDWFELNAVTFERLDAIFKAMDIDSTTIDEQKEGSKALRYFADELNKHALALAEWHEERMLSQDII